VDTLTGMGNSSPMDTQHVAYIILAGHSTPAVLTENKDGTWIATSPDWTVAAEGKDPNTALAELSREIDRRIEKAIAASRRPSQDVGEEATQRSA
jgi:predicted RNase H-like HicB family nuclease